MISIPQVDNVPYVNNAEFVKMTVTNEDNSTTVHTFSTSYKTEVIDGSTYLALGGLLFVGSQQRDLRVTSTDTTITLSGLTSDNIYLVMNTKIKGSTIEIWRGFYNENYLLVNTVRRYSGVITSYTITEDREDITDNFTISVNCSSYKQILDNSVSGRKTNTTSWKEFNPTDVSMDKVAALDNTYFDFGNPVGSSGDNSSSSVTLTAVVSPA